VEIAFIDEKGSHMLAVHGVANREKKWSAELPTLSPGAKGRLRIAGSDGEVKYVEDVAVGQVWLAGGQSNMTYRVGSANVSPETLMKAKQQAAAANPDVRFFITAYRGADEPQDDVVGKWVVADPENVTKCSAVAWYFGERLHRALKQPVGLIVSAVGGTPAEAWIPRPEFDATRASAAIWQRYREEVSSYSPDQDAKYQADLGVWLAKYPTPLLQFNNSHTHPREPHSPRHPTVPVRLYNGMIHGLEPYTIKGIIWFQGDGNSQHPEEYPELIRTLIKTWRRHWGAELPFYYAEINNMFAPQQKPVEPGPLPLIREAQNAALQLPKTDVVCTIDLGIAADAHFPVKEPVGDRFARLALSDVYRTLSGEIHSPQFSSFRIEGDRVQLSFKYAEGLFTRAATVKGFALRSADGPWVWAEGQIQDKRITLWNDEVRHPAAVRYAWANNPVISIENSAGLPLRPFRTDTESPK
jgi:sialate O-acetylesterase